MSDRHGGNAEDDAARSYCVFERDRALPRPTPWRPLMTDATARQTTSVKSLMARGIDFALRRVSPIAGVMRLRLWESRRNRDGNAVPGEPRP